MRKLWIGHGQGRRSDADGPSPVRIRNAASACMPVLCSSPSPSPSSIAPRCWCGGTIPDADAIVARTVAGNKRRAESHALSTRLGRGEEISMAREGRSGMSLTVRDKQTVAMLRARIMGSF